MERRTFVVAAGASVSTLLAGCIDAIDSNDGDGGNADDAGGPGSGSDATEHGAVLAAEAYVAAAADGDEEAMVETMHSIHPFNPENRDNESNGEWSVEWEGFENPEVDLRDEGFSTAEIRDLPATKFWFEESELEETLAGEDAALVTLAYETTEDGETVETEETFITLTENGEWKVFFPYEEPPEIPEGEPVADLDVVDELEYDTDTETVKVHFRESVTADITEVYVYSTSLQEDGRLYDLDSSDGFPVTHFSSAFDPDGDEIVVTVVVDGEERVVHRETYESEE